CLETSSKCLTGSAIRAPATCYYDSWLSSRLLKPLNCTLFYLKRGVEGYRICDPDTVVRNFIRIVSLDLSGTK
ncbi:hypothetical protein AAVH_29125, partial [Aphelenchoides avenae]